ncbi:helix-turn-helix domain-containing protein [Sciscionella marina]|uniref:helix-turn-helix domain-containing protein n=1 Tax=Sciscionella marina TaxID=508770 RepID=UPI00036C748B|nr:helix-turn-helix domain-containing protein [Sciscionella marina]
MRACEEASTTRISTTDVPPAERIEYWENYNAAALVGLRCSAFAARGLRADQANTDLGGMRIAEITGNEHVIERTPAHVRRLPSDSVFLSIIVRGNAFFYHGGGHIPVGSGEALLYDPAKPYLFGFGGTMQKILLDLPSAPFRERCLPSALTEPVKLGTTTTERALVQRLRAELLGESGAISAAELAERVWALGGALLGSPTANSHILLANAYIDAHLTDDRLTPAHVARAAGITARHLNRLLAAEGNATDGDTIAARITTRRLEAARSRLRAGDPRTIGNIAAYCGFTSQPHFTRLFNRRFGMSPREARAEYP